MTMSAAGKRDDRAAIDKAVCLLESFGDDAATGVGVSELARRAALSKSTAHRVLSMLERNGIVERAGTSYRIGQTFRDLGQAAAYAPGHEELRDLLIPYVADLYAATLETVHLTALHGTDVVYLVNLYGHRRTPQASRMGGRIPARCTAAGKALLAYQLDAAEQATGEQPSGLTERKVIDPISLTAEFARIRNTGIASEHGQIQRGVSSIAVPVFGPHGRPVAALSVSGPSDRVDERRYSSTLRRVASAAARALPTARRLTTATHS